MEKWFQKEVTVKESVYLVLVAIGVIHVYLIVLEFVFPEFPDLIHRSGTYGLTIASFRTPIFLLGAAFFEEVIFRLPLSGAVKLEWKFWKIICLAILISTVFGLMHGSWANIPAQGVIGMILSIIYLKCGGIKRNIGQAITVSTMMHFTFNAISLVLLYGSGVRVI